jgi:molecular chaperone GrpE
MAEENVKNHTQEKVENTQQEETVGNENNKVEETKDKVTEDKADGKEKKASSENKKKSKKEKKQIEELQTKLVELSDKHLRLQAEFDNFRRRTLKEKAELIKSAGESTIVTLLPIIDDFERALESLKDISDNDSGKQGTLLIYTKFKDFLKQNNVKEIEALNQDFDVDLHEAVTKIPAPDKKQKGKVVDVIQKGYLLNDKVIRFAKVVVGE